MYFNNIHSLFLSDCTIFVLFVKLSFVQKLSLSSFLDFINSIYIFGTNSKNIKVVNMEDRFFGDSNQFLRFLVIPFVKRTAKDA